MGRDPPNGAEPSNYLLIFNVPRSINGQNQSVPWISVLHSPGRDSCATTDQMDENCVQYGQRPNESGWIGEIDWINCPEDKNNKVIKGGVFHKQKLIFAIIQEFRPLGTLNALQSMQNNSFIGKRSTSKKRRWKEDQSRKWPLGKLLIKSRK